jgi:hypothetical protein
LACSVPFPLPQHGHAVGRLVRGDDVRAVISVDIARRNPLGRGTGSEGLLRPDVPSPFPGNTPLWNQRGLRRDRNYPRQPRHCNVRGGKLRCRVDRWLEGAVPFAEQDGDGSPCTVYGERVEHAISIHVAGGHAHRTVTDRIFLARRERSVAVAEHNLKGVAHDERIGKLSPFSFASIVKSETEIGHRVGHRAGQWRLECSVGEAEAGSQAKGTDTRQIDDAVIVEISDLAGTYTNVDDQRRI